MTTFKGNISNQHFEVKCEFGTNLNKTLINLKFRDTMLNLKEKTEK